jgi:GDP-L-fucose synthase
MPDGNPRKLIDTTRLNDLGWRPITNLDTGLEQTYKWYLENNIN